MTRYSLLFLLLVPFSIWAQSNGKIEEKADLYFSMQEYKMAVTLYDSLLNESNESIKYLKKSGQCYLNLGEGEKALNRFKEALRIHGSDPDILYMLGSAYDKINRTDSSIHYFNKYLLVNPGNINAQNRLAIIYLDMPGYEDSVKVITNRVLKENPEHTPSYYIQAMSYINNSRYVDAIFSARKGLESDSSYSMLYIPLGLGHYYRGDYLSASKSFERGLEIAENKAVFTRYAVLARLMLNTPGDIILNTGGTSVTFRELNSRTLSKMMGMVKTEESEYYYPRLLARFNDNPLSFGLDDFIMLYIGFTTDKNYGPYQDESEFERLLKSDENFEKIINAGSEHLTGNPIDIPVYLKMADVSSYMGLTDRYYLNLFRYYGFINAILATGTGKSPEDAIIICLLSHAKIILSELDYGIITEEISEMNGIYYIRSEILTEGNSNESFWFNIDIPYKKLLHLKNH